MSKQLLVLITTHLSTGGMPAIIASECKYLIDYDIHLFCVERSGLYISQRQVESMENVTLYTFFDSADAESDIWGEIQRLRPSFVVTHGKAHLYAELRAAGISIIHYCHSHFDPRTIEGSVGPLNGPRADLYLSVAPTVNENFHDCGIHNVIGIDSIIDTNRFDPALFDREALRRKRGIDPEDFIISYCGIVAPHKNQGGAIDIFRGVRDRIGRAKLILIGPLADNFRTYWEPVVADADGDPDIIFMGERGPLELDYAVSDAYIHPSHMEANSVAIREAAAMGLPCVIKNLKTNHAIFPPDIFKFASTEDDGSEFIEALVEIAARRNDQQETNERGRQWVVDKYGPETYSRTMRGIYREYNRGKPLDPVPAEDPLDLNIIYKKGGVYLRAQAPADGTLGLRVLAPDSNGGTYWENEVAAAKGERYFFHYHGKPWHIPYHSQVLSNGAIIAEERLDLASKRVYIAFDSSALGDTFAWLPAALAFQKKHGCKAFISTFWNNLLDGRIEGDIDLVAPGFTDYDIMYKVGIFKEADQRRPWRSLPLRQVAGDILGVEAGDEPCRLRIGPADMPGVPRPYICISEHASTQAKMWNNPNGWGELAATLIGRGYAVVAISREPTQLEEVIDLTGDINIVERAKQLAGAEMFIGGSSGLAWLANAVGTHVVILNSCTSTWHEFQDNCTHVRRADVCSGCWNDLKYTLDKSWDFCPSGLDFQCSRYLAAPQVIAAAEKRMKI